ncbi:S-protein homolog 24 [Ziziphus jujuba]|uniref:S-protein homolog n=1 Tax=Ziziphus jujuba TaxID=326968 RepID=A0A6P4A324_ZIZJJ|nr:S-protein homolog 24 [Ziziphus jujuba]
MGSTSALKVYIILAIAYQIGLFSPALTKFNVVIVNYLGENAILNLHCQSKDDDLGAHDLPYTNSFNWSFNVNIWKTTLYHCDMGSGDLKGHFDIFVAKRDMNRCGDDKCVWRVNRDVLYLYIIDVDDYVCQFDWPK